MYAGAISVPWQLIAGFFPGAPLPTKSDQTSQPFSIQQVPRPQETAANPRETQRVYVSAVPPCLIFSLK